MVYSLCNKCRKKITTDMEVCPYCDNKFTPDMFNSHNICKCNGVECDLTLFVNDILNGKEADLSEIFTDLFELTNCMNNTSLYCEIWDNNGKVPEIFNGPTEEEQMEEDTRWHREHPSPKCPTCGSINIREIGWGERTLSVNLFGLGSKKINKSFECNNCGYTW